MPQEGRGPEGSAAERVDTVVPPAGEKRELRPAPLAGTGSVAVPAPSRSHAAEQVAPSEPAGAASGDASGELLVDDLPTVPLVASPPPGLVVERASTPRPSGLGASSEERALPSIQRKGVEDLDTMRLAAQPASQMSPRMGERQGEPRSPSAALTTAPTAPLPAMPVTARPAMPQRLPREQVAFQAPLTPPSLSPATPVPPVTPAALQSPVGRALPEERSAEFASAAAPAARPRRSARPLVVALLLLTLLLIGGGLTAWVFVDQPFSVPAITQPQQSFSDQRLGLALSYPHGWRSQVDYSQSSVTFSDSTHTGEMVVRIAPAGQDDASHYLQKEVAQLGLSNLKSGTALSFAGTTWQQAQGAVLIQGATYTETLFVTEHAGHLYTFIQLAHQQIYADEEEQVFAPTRASLRFL